MTLTIGFIGTGAMGAAIAGRLVGHHDLLINDRHRAATDGLVAAGAAYAEVAEIATGCETVFLCLPGPTQVESLVLGPGGLVETLREGSVLIDTSTSTPVLDRRIQALLAERNIGFVDAPIGGGVRRAREGTATLMVGGMPDDVARVRPLLALVTTAVITLGGPGTGHAMKLVNNLLNGCNRFAALEAVRLGRLCGIDQDTVIEVVNSASGRNYTTEYSYTQLRQGDTWLPQGFTLDLMLKDLHLATELAGALSHRTPIGELVESMTQQAVERFGSDADQSTLMSSWYDASAD